MEHFKFSIEISPFEVNPIFLDLAVFGISISESN